MNQKLITPLLIFILILLGITIATSLLYGQIHTKQYNTLDRSIREVNQKLLEQSKSEEDSPKTLLAKYPRIANIISYTIDKNRPLSAHSDFIQSIAKEIKSDNIDAIAYQNLIDMGVKQPEFRLIENDQYRFRERWNVLIKPTSHFYSKRPKLTLFVNESFSVPSCSSENGFKPYVMWLPTDQGMQVEIEQHYDAKFNSYRVTAKNGEGVPILFNTTQRILVDAGCYKESSKSQEEE